MTVSQMIQEMRAQRAQDKQTMADLDAAFADAKARRLEAKAEEARACAAWCQRYCAPQDTTAPTSDVIAWASSKAAYELGQREYRSARARAHAATSVECDRDRDRVQHEKAWVEREADQLRALVSVVLSGTMPDAAPLVVAARAWEQAQRTPFDLRLSSLSAPAAFWRRMDTAPITPECLATMGPGVLPLVTHDWILACIVASEMELRHIVYCDEETDADLRQARALLDWAANTARTAISPYIEGLVALGLCLPMPTPAPATSGCGGTPASS